jgi:hypothetical protein
MNLRPLDPGGGHVPHQDIHVSRPRQQGDVAQSDGEKCQGPVGTLDYVSHKYT